MTDLSNKINQKENEKKLFQKLKKVNMIKNLKDHKEKDQISKIITEYNKKQEEDYFFFFFYI